VCPHEGAHLRRLIVLFVPFRRCDKGSCSHPPNPCGWRHPNVQAHSRSLRSRHLVAHLTFKSFKHLKREDMDRGGSWRLSPRRRPKTKNEDLLPPKPNAITVVTTKHEARQQQGEERHETLYSPAQQQPTRHTHTHTHTHQPPPFFINPIAQPQSQCCGGASSNRECDEHPEPDGDPSPHGRAAAYDDPPVFRRRPRTIMRCPQKPTLIATFCNPPHGAS
jgi:hypothetical protein